MAEKLKGPLDGNRAEYHFGHDLHKSWETTASSLERAVRMFRVGCLFHERYVDPKTGLVPVWATVDREWKNLANIKPGDAEATPDMDPRLLAALEAVPASSSTSLQAAGAATGLRSASRSAMESKARELEERLAALEATKRDLMALKDSMEAELNKRRDQIWVIELFLGCDKEVVFLRDGDPAPLGTPIHVRQRVLCMDEEIAVHDWFNNPERIGKFDWQNLEDFDKWVAETPGALDLICPWQKGIVGLRVRRKELSRSSDGSFMNAFANAKEAAFDAMTYILVRNGEQLYRLWVDVHLWPRMFPSMADVPGEDKNWGRDREAAARVKNQMAGLVAIQGMLERSDILNPLPPGISVFDPKQEGENFVLIRDGEKTKQLADNSSGMAHLTWHGYRDWLREQLAEGVRVLYIGGRRDLSYDKLEERTGLRTVESWPSFGEIYTLDTVVEKGRWGSRGDYGFLYLPDAPLWSEVERTRRVRFLTYGDEVVPYDFMSWRVLEHLLRDRSQRESYADFFRVAFDWWRLKKEEALREQPFIDLALKEAGYEQDDEPNRARAERILRWWKIKTKTHRDLSSDEPKALRMVVKALKAGDDHPDPETLLFR